MTADLADEAAIVRVDPDDDRETVRYGWSVARSIRRGARPDRFCHGGVNWGSMPDDEGSEPDDRARDADEDWRDVDDEVGLSERPWWQAAEDREHVEPPAHPDDEQWHDREHGPSGPMPGPSVGDRDATGGWFASLDRAQRLALFGAAGLLVLLGLLAATYVLVLTGASGPQADPPQASFESSYDADAGDLTLTHAGGGVVATDRLVVVVDGEPHDDWTATGEELSIGDELRVRSVAPGATGTLQWRDPADDVEVPVVEFEASE